MQAIDPRERAGIFEELTSSDEEVRRLAVERMALLAPGEALPRLIEILGDESWRVRKAAIDRLAGLPDTQASSRALVAALADSENTGRRNAALEALVRGGSTSVDALVEAAEDEDADVRKQAVDALAGIGVQAASPCLLGLLQDPDANVRAAAADALAGFEDDQCVPALLGTARQDPEVLVRLSALRALVRAAPPIETAELEPLLEDPHLRSSALELLALSEEPRAVELLLKGLESGSRAAREAAMGGLCRAAARAEPAECERLMERARSALLQEGRVCDALSRLESAPLRLRLTLIQFLGLLGLPEAVVPILEAARDEALTELALGTLIAQADVAEKALAAAWDELDDEERLLAAAVLGQGGDAEAEACLLEALRARDPGVRTAAARALGERGSVSALERLVGRLHAAASLEGFEADGELEAVSEAIGAIAEANHGGPQDGILERLTSELSGAHERYRRAAAEILARVGGDGAEALRLLLSDPSPAVRRAAVEGVAELEGEEVSEWLRTALSDESAPVRSAAAGALGAQQDARGLTDLAALVSDAEPRVRAAALRGLAKRLSREEIQDERPLVEALIEQGLAETGHVAMAAAEALAELGGEAVTRLARGLLDREEPELVQAAADCLARHGSDEALGALVPLLSHADWSVRAHAVQMLAERGAVRRVPAILRRLELEQDAFVRDVMLRALRRLEP